jgi:peptide chain release factor 1
MLSRLKDAEGRYEGLSEQLSQPDIVNDPTKMKALMQEYRRMTPIIEKYREYKTAEQTVAEAESLLATEKDDELHLLAS